MRDVKRSAVARGFSLVEMILVVVIIGILAGTVIYNFVGQGETARITATKAKISQIKSAIDTHKLNNGQYPTSLVELTQGTNPLLERVPKDAWRNEFFYVVTPGQGRPYLLASNGPDGEYGTPDDIDRWTMEDE